MIKPEHRTTFIQKSIYYMSLLIFIMTTVAGWFGIDLDKTKIKIDTLSCQQEITGWGTSACWWAQELGAIKSGSADEITELLFSKDGLGLNVYRYNIGAGSKDNPDTRLDRNSSRSTESFLVYDEATGEYKYDWNKDAAAQSILMKALSYGCVDTVVLFANSPHYSMCVSGQASGGFEKAQSNLKKECYQDFVDYFLDITEHFIEMGVPVKYISPINEPQWDWGGEWVGQEGCHYELDEAVELMKLFAKSIKDRNLDVKLCALESGQVGDHAMDAIDMLWADEEIRDVLGVYSYHSYWTDRNFLLKRAFGQYMSIQYPQVELEMSEWCELPNNHEYDDIEAGLLMARTISEDVALSGCNNWSSWVAVNEGGEKADSMIAVGDDYSEYKISKRYYAMAHYSKFIPVGSRLVDSDLTVADITAEKAWWKDTIDGKEYDHYEVTNNMNVSAYRTPDGNYVAVIVNEGEAKEVCFNMLWYDMQVYTTDSEKNLELTNETKGYKSIEIGADSITTVVFSK